MNKKISILIPVYNEERNIKPLYDRLEKVMNKEKYDYEILFVDDGSRDNTEKEIEKLHKKNRKVRLIVFSKNYGKADAMQAGFDSANGDVIITMDGDLQDLPEEIPSFLKEIGKSDLVVGWRYKRHDKFLKKVPSLIFNNLARFLIGLKIHDANCGFKAMKKEVARNIEMYGELHRYLPALAHVKGYKVSEIKIKHAERLHGKTKYGANRMVRGFFDLLTVKFLSSFAKKPFHFFGGLGLFSFLIGFVIGSWLFILWLLTGTIGGHTPAAIFSMLLIILGIQLISLGLLGEMIASIKSKEKSYNIKRKL